MSRDVTWPYSLADSAAIDAWLDQLEARRSLESADKLLQRCIAQMELGPPRARADYRLLDGQIWRRLLAYEHQRDEIYFVDEGHDGEAVYRIIDPSNGEAGILPHYTTDLPTALALWPDDERPLQWAGTVWDCCIAGLKARKAHIKRKRMELG